MGKPEKDVSQALEEFLGYIEECRQRYKEANEAMNLEDKRLQDVLHEMEFSRDENEERRVGRKIKRSRRARRRNKDEVARLRPIVSFFAIPANKEMLNKMRKLIQEQRREEENLRRERVYKPRVREG